VACAYVLNFVVVAKQINKSGLGVNCPFVGLEVPVVLVAPPRVELPLLRNCEDRLITDADIHQLNGIVGVVQHFKSRSCLFKLLRISCEALAKHSLNLITC